MKQIFLTITLISMLAILPFAIFAQVKDTDGDGVSDRDDLCIHEKGTKANKGCPANAKVAKPSTSAKPESTDDPETEEFLKDLEKTLDEESASKTSGNKPKIAKSLEELGCKVIVAGEGCGKIALWMTKIELENILGQPETSNVLDTADKEFIYTANGIRVIVGLNQKVKGIIFVGWEQSAKGQSRKFDGVPDKKLAWKSTIAQVKRAYGKPVDQTISPKLSVLTYGNIEFYFRNQELVKITVF